MNPGKDREERRKGFPVRKTGSTRRLKALARDLQSRREMEEGIQTAKAKQQRLLPEAPRLEGYEFYTYYRAATAISGDFYDYVQVAPGKVGIVIGDVTGHGIAAAIIMGMAMKTINIFGRGRGNANEVLDIVNQELCRDLDDLTFVSAAYGILDARSHSIRFVRAGHNFPVLCRPTLAKPVTTVSSNGMVLGMNQKTFTASLEEKIIPLEPGDTFLQYTDGLSECMNPLSEEFGEQRILEIIEGFRMAKLELMVNELVRQAAEFAGKREMEDDITILAVRRVR